MPSERPGQNRAGSRRVSSSVRLGCIQTRCLAVRSCVSPPSDVNSTTASVEATRYREPYLARNRTAYAPAARLARSSASPSSPRARSRTRSTVTPAGANSIDQTVTIAARRIAAPSRRFSIHLLDERGVRKLRIPTEPERPLRGDTRKSPSRLGSPNTPPTSPKTSSLTWPESEPADEWPHGVVLSALAYPVVSTDPKILWSAVVTWLGDVRRARCPAAGAAGRREILDLRWTEVDEAGGVVRLSPERSKTPVGRVLPISPPIAAVLARRRARRRPGGYARVSPRWGDGTRVAGGVAAGLSPRRGAGPGPP